MAFVVLLCVEFTLSNVPSSSNVILNSQQKHHPQSYLSDIKLYNRMDEAYKADSVGRKGSTNVQVFWG